MWHVTLPGIKSTIIVLLIMNLGWVMNASFEVPYILGSGLLQDVSQTIDIFVLKYGMNIGNYSLATAAGIFKSVISLFLVFSTNAIANKIGREQFDVRRNEYDTKKKTTQKIFILIKETCVQKI